jgi:hypothetical protein
VLGIKQWYLVLLFLSKRSFGKLISQGPHRLLKLAVSPKFSSSASWVLITLVTNSFLIYEFLKTVTENKPIELLRLLQRGIPTGQVALSPWQPCLRRSSVVSKWVWSVIPSSMSSLPPTWGIVTEGFWWQLGPRKASIDSVFSEHLLWGSRNMREALPRGHCPWCYSVCSSHHIASGCWHITEGWPAKSDLEDSEILPRAYWQL